MILNLMNDLKCYELLNRPFQNSLTIYKLCAFTHALMDIKTVLTDHL